ncbi:hypothetical protein HDF19_02530 [Mucilaginibacter sp. E4BP6]|uniref:hypothetical protein n=1 Tax=Mucilaginibacter sp. E4BP6 TaxID=2723089 RepID=UPI0015CEB23F|nr:hypothetical protein [Mucilaginibacter sp. E4BP6]NYE64333.1 hypothetical protein [Mucilaginibacter sp. E4BP6]
MDNTSIADFSPEINYNKSLEKHRLIYKITGWLIFSLVFGYAFYLLMMFAAFQPLLHLITGHAEPIGLITCSLLVVSLMIFNIFCNNAFTKIEGKNLEDNKRYILLTMDEFFSNYDFKVNDDKIMRSFMPKGSPIWGRIITILFDGNDMYLNITSLGKSNSPTLVHGLINYLKARRIKKYFAKNYPVN